MQIFTSTVKFKLKIVALICIVAALGITAGENTPETIKPGEGFSNTSIQLQVQASSSTWTPSRATISVDTKELNFTVTGSVFLCGKDTSSLETDKFLVPADRSALIDTGMTVSEGEYVKFRLTPFEKEIVNCGTVLPTDFSFDEEGTFKDKSGTNLKVEDLCKGSDLYQGNKLIGSTSDYRAKYTKPSNNDDSWLPTGNKWLRSDSTGITPTGTPWFHGTFMDLRISEEIEDHPISAFDCTLATFNSTNPSKKFYKKFEAEIVNTACSKYARKGGSVFSHYVKKNAAGELEKDSSGRFIEFAEGLTAKIQDATAANLKCFDGSGNLGSCSTPVNYSTASSIESSSVRLNYDYKIPAGVQNNNLKIGIEDEAARYAGNKGGYSVEVTHSCVKSDGENLYIYIGDDPTGLKPGDAGTRLIGKVEDGKYKLVNTVPQATAGTTPTTPSPVTPPPASLNNSGKIFFLIKDNMDGVGGIENYSNNKGHYRVDFSINKSPTWISDAIHFVVDPLKKAIFRSSVRNPGDLTPEIDAGASHDLYRTIMAGGLQRVVYSLLILYIVITSLGFLLGLVELKTDQIFMILLKIGAVSILLRDNSWNILNKYLFNIFWYGADTLIGKFVDFYNDNATAGYKYDASFNFLDKTLGAIFAWENIVKFISLFFMGFSNPLAWALFVALIYAFIDMIKACFKGILLYCICVIINGFLVGLAPIFLCFLLFKTTFRFFDSWIKQLIGNMVSLTFYFIAIGMLNEILYNLIYQIFNFGAYKDCIIPISIGGLKRCIVYFPIPFAATLLVNSAAGGGETASAMANVLPINIPLVIVFIIFAKSMHIIIDVVKTLPISIFGAPMMYSGMDVADSAVEGAKFAIGQDRESKQRRERATKGMKSEGDGKQPRKVPTNNVSVGVNPSLEEPTPTPTPTPTPSTPTPTPVDEVDRNPWVPPTSAGAYEIGHTVAGDGKPIDIYAKPADSLPQSSVGDRGGSGSEAKVSRSTDTSSRDGGSGSAGRSGGSGS